MYYMHPYPTWRDWAWAMLQSDRLTLTEVLERLELERFMKSVFGTPNHL